MLGADAVEIGDREIIELQIWIRDDKFSLQILLMKSDDVDCMSF